MSISQVADMIARMFNQDAEAYTNMKTIQAVLRTYIRASTRVSQRAFHKPTSNGVSVFVFPDSDFMVPEEGRYGSCPKSNHERRDDRLHNGVTDHSYP